MKRLVGLPKRLSSKPSTSVPKRGLDDIVRETDQKIKELDSKIGECDADLRKVREQLKHASGVARTHLQNKAKGILLRKKRFEQQSEHLQERSWNVSGVADSISTAQDAKLICSVLTSGTKQLTKELGNINLDEVENIQDELRDLIEASEDVQSALSKSYEVPVDIDDEELNSQLDALGDEIVQDNDPSYIDQVLQQPPFNPGPLFPGSSPSPGKDVGGSGPVDEFGLPILNKQDSNTTTGEHPEAHR